jgi:hypothetical protein
MPSNCDQHAGTEMIFTSLVALLLIALYAIPALLDMSGLGRRWNLERMGECRLRPQDR